MTCKIDRLTNGENGVILRLCGRIQVEHVSTIKALIDQEPGAVALDLAEITIIDRDAVSFLASCERQGVELMNRPAFLSEWIAKEQLRIATKPFHE